jgi:glycosyltransferase involved in cell wall biosynthesis
VKVNVAVCGRFHLHNYIRYLDQAGVLNCFYYSHKRSTDAANLGIQRNRAINLWAKEYLIRLHGKLDKVRPLSKFTPYYAALWQMGALHNWTDCDLLHFVMDGASKRLIARARQEGSVIVAEAVTAHPSLFGSILREESETLGLDDSPPFHTSWERQLDELGCSDYLLVASRFVRDSFTKRGFDADKTAVLPYGVDLMKFHPREDAGNVGSDATFRVICVGTISPYKGQVYLLDAWKKLGLPKAELLLIGPINDKMRSVLRRYDRLFRHTSFVRHDEMRHQYASSSVFVLPSLQDGFGLVCGEAMACGLPVITTVNAGAADIITHGKDGFVLPIRSPNAIAEHIEMLYRDRELRAAMSSAALAKARSELGWDKYAIRLCDFYRSVLERGNGSRTSASTEPRAATAS